MDLSLMILIDSCIGLIIALLFCFFGYKLARPLLPLPGMIVLEVLIYVYIFGTFKTNSIGTWLFFGGVSIILYVILFLIPRIAGFFTGVLGSAMLLLFIISSFGLQNIDYLYPACLTICAASGLLTVVYEKNGVIVFTSVFGACAASFIGMHMYLKGVSEEILQTENVLIYLRDFLSSNAHLITGISIALLVAGMLIQALATSQGKTLSGNPDIVSKRKARDNNFLSGPDGNEEEIDQRF